MIKKKGDGLNHHPCYLVPNDTSPVQHLIVRLTSMLELPLLFLLAESIYYSGSSGHFIVAVPTDVFIVILNGQFR
ncbi:hypothetical protein DXV75_11860 [Alteromonas aestuariivivens]|uniref:Uncharacterized protein n=1 Tax=Alteromonas aestuariivivens TaxID=1938339 RepID=A0A3D8M502_9ALTE|nr:hypothetical protein DXV75_11860 [Alteromonas aestuariivivens]